MRDWPVEDEAAAAAKTLPGPVEPLADVPTVESPPKQPDPDGFGREYARLLEASDEELEKVAAGSLRDPGQRHAVRWLMTGGFRAGAK